MEEQKETSNSKILKNQLNMPIAIIMAGIIIGGAVYFSNKNQAADNIGQLNTNQQKPGAQTVDIDKVKITGSPKINPLTAETLSLVRKAS